MIFLFAVFTAIDLFLGICQYEYVFQSLLNGCNASWVLAADDIRNLLRKLKTCFINNLRVLDDIDRDVMVDESQNVQINKINRTLNLHNVFFSHLIASGVLYNSHAAV